MANKATVYDNSGTIALAGLMEMPVHDLLALQPTDFNKSGAILLNDRQKVLIPCETGAVDETGAPVVRHVEYTLSVYVTREPLTDEERFKCDAIGKGQQARKAEKEATEKREREEIARRNLEIGRTSVMDAARMLSNLQQGQTQAANVLADALKAR